MGMHLVTEGRNNTVKENPQTRFGKVIGKVIH